MIRHGKIIVNQASLCGKSCLYHGDFSHIFLRLSRNSEVITSKFECNLEEMFPQYFIHSDVYRVQTYCVSHIEKSLQHNAST